MGPFPATARREASDRLPSSRGYRRRTPTDNMRFPALARRKVSRSIVADGLGNSLSLKFACVSMLRGEWYQSI